MFSAVALVCLGTFLAPFDDKQPAKNPREGENEYNVKNYLSRIAFDKAATQKLNITLTNPKLGKQLVRWVKEKGQFETRDRNNAPETCAFRITYYEMDLRDKFFLPRAGAPVHEAQEQNTTLAQRDNNFFFRHTGVLPLTPGATANEKRYFLVQAELDNLHFYDKKPGLRGTANVHVKRTVLLELTWDGARWSVNDVHRNARSYSDPGQSEIDYASPYAMGAPPSLIIRKPSGTTPFDGEVKVTTDSGCTVTVKLYCGGVEYNPFITFPDPTVPGGWVSIFGYWPVTGECTLCVTSTNTATGESTTICIPIIQPAP